MSNEGVKEEQVQPASNILRLPRHDFLVLPEMSQGGGSLRRSTPDEEKNYAIATESAILEIKDDIGIPLSEGLLETVVVIQDNFERWAKEKLGLDIAARRVSIDRFRRLPKSDEDYNPNNKGGHVTRSHLIVIPELSGDDFQVDIDPENMEKHNLSHEIIHTYGSQIWVVAHPEEQKDYIKHHFRFGQAIATGFSVERIEPSDGKRQRSFGALSESVIELINIEQLDELRKNNGPDLLNNLPTGYPPDLVFFDMVFDKMAEKKRITPEEMRKQIYTKYFKGRSQIAHEFVTLFGHEAAGIIAALENNSMDYINLTIAYFNNTLQNVDDVDPSDQPSYHNVHKLMTLIGIDPKEYASKVVDLAQNKGVTITGTSGKIHFDAVLL